MLCLRHYEKVAKMFSIYVFPDPLASVKIRIEDLSVEMKSANKYMQMVFLQCNISDTNRLDQDWRVKLIAVKFYNPSDWPISFRLHAWPNTGHLNT